MMGLLCFVYLVCSIRTNLIFFLIFFTLVPAFMLLAGSYFKVASGDANMGKKLAEASGAFCFVTCCCGWYIFFAIMLASVDFPLDLPRKFFLFGSHGHLSKIANQSSCRFVSHCQGRKRKAQDQSRRISTISVQGSCARLDPVAAGMLGYRRIDRATMSKTM